MAAEVFSENVLKFVTNVRYLMADNFAPPLQEEASVKINQIISRDSSGRALEGRTIVIVDVVPTDDDYKLDVVVQPIPPELINTLKKYPLPDISPK